MTLKAKVTSLQTCQSQIWKANLTLKFNVTSFELIRDLYLIKTQFNFVGKIQNGSKVITYTGNYTNI